MSTYFGFPSCKSGEGKPYLFISYKSEESKIAAKYARYLYDNGIRLYYDDALEPADDWEGKLLEAIEDKSCYGVIMMVSSLSLESPHVHNEAKTANHCGKPILGVFIENVTVTKQPMKTYLGGIQSVSAWNSTDEKNTFAKVLHGAIKMIDKSYLPASRKTSADEMYEKAWAFVRSFGMRNTDLSYKNASESLKTMTVQFPTDYRGWYGLATLCCYKIPSSYKESVSLLKQAEDYFINVVALGFEKQTTEEFTSSKSRLWKRILNLFSNQANSCEKAEHLEAIITDLSGLDKSLSYTDEAVRKTYAELLGFQKEILKNTKYINHYFEYSNYSNGAVITKATLWSDTDIFIPSLVLGSKPVIKIASDAFSECKHLTSVVIPDSVTSIGDSAFKGCSRLTSVIIPDSVTSIGDLAFSECTSLTSITIPNSVTRIGKSSFLECGCLASVTLPDSITSIGEHAFSECRSLTSITMPNSVTSINKSTFSHCRSLSSVILPNSLTSLGEFAFYECGSLASITIPASVTNIGEGAFGKCKNLTSITIPNSITSIGKSVFLECGSLSSVTLPDSLTSIGEYAFSECSSLTSITIPNSVTYLGYSAFSGCNGIKSVEVICLSDCKMTLIENKLDVTSIIISQGVKSISENAFNGNIKLTSVTICQGVTTIEKGAFQGCSSLTSVAIPDSVTSINDNAFQGCSSLTSVSIPDSVTSIGNKAFQECSSMTSITIPDSITSIGDKAFQGCRSLTSVTIPDSITSIGDKAFQGCRSLTSVTIPDSITEIRDFAFDGCSSMTSVLIGNNVKRIGKYAFSECSHIKTVTIPDSVMTIKEGAFLECRSLHSVKIGTNITAIDRRMFCGCYALKSVIIPNSVTSISYDAFDIDCQLYDIYPDDRQNDSLIYTYKVNHIWSKIESVTVICVSNCNVEAIEEELRITSVVISDGITSIDNMAFSESYWLTSVIIPDSVTSIGYDAFRKCSDLISVSIPDSVTCIGDGAFFDCDALTVYCSEKSFAWKYCKKNSIPHKPLEQAICESTDNNLSVPTSVKNSSSHWLIPVIIALLIATIVVSIQLSGLFDLLSWLKGLFG